MTKKHYTGDYETVKFEHRRQPFYDYLEFLNSSNLALTDVLEHFPAYVGHMSLHRVLTLYEFYKMTSTVAGHIAEVGVYKASSLFLFAKLVKIHENESLTQVHGFDWFKGAGPSGEKDSNLVPEGHYAESYDFVLALAQQQRIDNIVRVHNLDIRDQLEPFFTRTPHLRFRMVFLDCGLYDVMKVAVPMFWERLTPGGIMVLDQYSHEHAPGDVFAVQEFLGSQEIKTLPNSWMPNAYIVK